MPRHQRPERAEDTEMIMILVLPATIGPAVLAFNWSDLLGPGIVIAIMIFSILGSLGKNQKQGGTDSKRSRSLSSDDDAGSARPDFNEMVRRRKEKLAQLRQQSRTASSRSSQSQPLPSQQRQSSPAPRAQQTPSYRSSTAAGASSRSSSASSPEPRNLTLAQMRERAAAKAKYQRRAEELQEVARQSEASRSVQARSQRTPSAGSRQARQGLGSQSTRSQQDVLAAARSSAASRAQSSSQLQPVRQPVAAAPSRRISQPATPTRSAYDLTAKPAFSWSATGKGSQGQFRLNTSRASLRQAIIWKELLDKPVSLRSAPGGAPIF